VLRFLVWGYFGSQAKGVWWSPRPDACGASLGCCCAPPRPHNRDRPFWICASPWFASWRNSLLIVKPETVPRWHRRGWRACWSWRSNRGWNEGRRRFPRNFTRYPADDCRKSAPGLSLRRCAAPARKLPCGRRRGGAERNCTVASITPKTHRRNYGGAARGQHANTRRCAIVPTQCPGQWRFD
jgi:hypothetical protein